MEKRSQCSAMCQLGIVSLPKEVEVWPASKYCRPYCQFTALFPVAYCRQVIYLVFIKLFSDRSSHWEREPCHFYTPCVGSTRQGFLPTIYMAIEKKRLATLYTRSVYKINLLFIIEVFTANNAVFSNLIYIFTAIYFNIRSVVIRFFCVVIMLFLFGGDFS